LSDGLCRHSLATNVSQLGEVAEIEAQMFSFAKKFNRRTAVEFSTEPAILPNCCYLLPLFSVAFVVGWLSVGKKHTLLQALVCALALCGLQMCVLVRWLVRLHFRNRFCNTSVRFRQYLVLLVLCFRVCICQNFCQVLKCF